MNDWSITIALPQGLTVGGLTSWALRIGTALAARGREVHLVIHEPPAGYGKLDAAALANRKRLHCIAAPAISDESWSACMRCYRQLLPTLVMPAVWAESYGIAAALATTAADRLRVLAWNHSDNPYDYAYLRYYEPMIHAYVVNTRRCREQLNSRLVARRGDVVTIPHGVEAPPMSARSPIGNRPLRLIYAGRMDQLVKRVLDFPKLAEMLDRRGVRFEMRLIGDGPQTEQLSAAVVQARSRFGIAENQIRVEPPVGPQEMAGVWSSADVSMLASAHEGMSVAMLEAMAAGCVPVVSRVGSGAAEVIEHDRNGLLFPIGDTDAMADCIAGLAADETTLRRMSEAARKTILDAYSFGTHADAVERMIGKIIDEPARWWPASRSIDMARTVAQLRDEQAAIPSDAAQRLRSTLADIAARGEGPVAIYGAGRHTKCLAGVWAESPVEIRAVIDDDPGLFGKSLWGWPIIEADELPLTGARSVVISSWFNEREMLRRAARFETMGVRVIGLYETNNEVELASLAHA